MKICKKRSGFTLIEMTIVLFIISLLILIIVPNLNGQRKKAESVHNNAMISLVQSQIDAYLIDKGDSNVTYQSLKENDYLNSSQISRAEKQGINIDNNKAIKKE
ncbi:prepilin-type N-terminal cleavage/methylation domain-containing protein [Apilactobacillus micheneri]|uniref:Prepilin-type N-terminal cleavage/methylation domain-containing protein n=1 Tax=Apilactobacillus micheneri TaxID=1899430 RepID=A0ABY2YWE4_9LACO|nr:competence type IV pilus major pilin ComGC [Apilactobacillus micheneri]TPR24378.1 prepilin-type N-terminal cleavage/methylation domain-containing protein [Apilactobacillus micheneri]TPR25397.1 prepilin-type N-terminal cleavage/methylation domain-containing protein [Apilactobacillus micheneri]TPR27709.1 prepilin-type N-terminal cleavage/methylation domain-containing protein [Apilactobacillus micheneri]TPR28974.1 prepilin-type N-terminal cleavage/methylation domain-containing protein [Apilacto